MPGLLPLLALALLLPTPEAPEGPRMARVVAEQLDVFDRPSDAAIVTGGLVRGAQVVVQAGEDDGWMAINPPPGSLSWIDEDAIRVEWTNRARVILTDATVRAGAPGARLPGARAATVGRGTVVRLLDRKPLTLRRGNASQTLRAIAPTSRELRYVRSDGIEFFPDPTRDADAAGGEGSALIRRASQAAPVPSVDRRFVNLGSAFDTSRMSADLAARIAEIEDQHRAILRRPIDQWQLDSIRRRYQELLDTQSDPTLHAALRARLDRLARQESAVKAAKAIEATLQQARSRDRDMAALRERINQLGTVDNRPYDAEGLLQASSKQVDGQLVFALVGPKGETTAYLSLPAGIDGAKMVARRVGVRGEFGFNEDLRARVIKVRDLEPLSKAP